MTKITQISTAAVLAIFASTAFVSTADAGSKKEWCKETSSKMYRTACELQKRKRDYRRPTHPTVRVLVNFRGRSDVELAARSLNGGDSNGGNGGNGGKR